MTHADTNELGRYQRARSANSGPRPRPVARHEEGGEEAVEVVVAERWKEEEATSISMTRRRLSLAKKKRDTSGE
jgi:hypothetical protein